MLTKIELDKKRDKKRKKRNNIKAARKHLYGDNQSVLMTGSSKDQRRKINKLTINLWKMKPSKRLVLLNYLNKQG